MSALAAATRGLKSPNAGALDAGLKPGSSTEHAGSNDAANDTELACSTGADDKSINPFGYTSGQALRAREKRGPQDDNIGQ